MMKTNKDSKNSSNSYENNYPSYDENLLPLGIYIHVPFCRKKCDYCGFYSKEGSLNENRENEYLNEILSSIKKFSYIYGKNYSENVKKFDFDIEEKEKLNNANEENLILESCLKNKRQKECANKKYIVDTIFFGGGTPSLLKPDTIEQILLCLRENFDVGKNIEITLECNPNEIDLKKMIEYKKMGINRLSIGIQSFDDEILKSIGRTHLARSGIEAVKNAKKAGFQNVSIDLIFALPNQKEETFLTSLKTALSLDIEHISIYSLELEEGTKLYKEYKNEEKNFPSKKESNRMYLIGNEYLEKNGFNRYEISNFSKENYESRHNLKYWNMDSYLSFGKTGASFIENMRFNYEEPKSIKINTIKDNIDEYMFTGLRKKEGINIEDFEKKFKLNFWEYFKDSKEELLEYEKKGLVKIKDKNIFLTNDGILISNDIILVFI